MKLKYANHFRKGQLEQAAHFLEQGRNNTWADNRGTACLSADCDSVTLVRMQYVQSLNDQFTLVVA